jgi:acetylornithine/succinyldiaminopimelate/putrescine aminotransferase
MLDKLGTRFLGTLTACSAVSSGHAHPRSEQLVTNRLAHLNIISQTLADILTAATESPHA